MFGSNYAEWFEKIDLLVFGDVHKSLDIDHPEFDAQAQSTLKRLVVTSKNAQRWPPSCPHERLDDLFLAGIKDNFAFVVSWMYKCIRSGRFSKVMVEAKKKRKLVAHPLRLLDQIRQNHD